MSRNKLILALVAIVGLGGLCLYLNRDWFATQPIQISHRVSPWLANARTRRFRGGEDLGTPVVFSLDSYYKFTSVKVFKAAEIATNKYAHPVWDMISDSNSMPMASFSYGGYLRGMYPSVKGARPDPLEAGVTYRLVVQTSDDKDAGHDFLLPPAK